MKSSKIYHKKVKCVDDTLLYDNSIKHSTTLGIICLCTSNGIAINNQKFQLCMKTVTFPGLNITPSGITPYSNMLPVIRDFTVPQNIIGAQSWFGLVNQVAWAHSISKMMQPS